MTNIVKFPEKKYIQKEAAKWLVKLDGGKLSNGEILEFSEWVNASIYHKDALVNLGILWDKMEVLSELSSMFPNTYKNLDAFNNKLIPSYRLVTVSIIILLPLIIAYLIFNQGYGSKTIPSSIDGQMEKYATSIGEQKDILLPDGSSLTLNTDSVLIAQYATEKRLIRLIKGEVYVKVAHDASRPFFVRANSGLVRAVGTAFSVRLKNTLVEITVTEGKVQVASGVEEINDYINGNNNVNTKMLMLGAGETVTYSKSRIDGIEKIEPDVVSRKLSWQTGMLEFKGESLGEVVSEISRYTDTEIVITDPSIENIRIGGFFKTGEVDALLTVLEDGFPVEIKRVGNNIIYLSSE